jgi:hypothetical protein
VYVFLLIPLYWPRTLIARYIQNLRYFCPSAFVLVSYTFLRGIFIHASVVHVLRQRRYGAPVQAVHRGIGFLPLLTSLTLDELTIYIQMYYVIALCELIHRPHPNSYDLHSAERFPVGWNAAASHLGG